MTRLTSSSRELRDADAIWPACPGPSCTLNTPSQLAPLASCQHGVFQFLRLGLRALDHRHATAADGVAVELDGGFRIERLVDRFQRRRFLVLAAHGYDRALAIDVIQVLIADDGGNAVFAHHLLDHIRLRRLLVLRECQIARDEIDAVCAGRRRKAGRQHLAVLPGTGREAEIHGRDEACAAIAELLLLDVGLGVGAALEQGVKDGACRFGVRLRRDAQNVGVQLSRERGLGRLWLDILGQRRCGQGCQSHGKH